MIGKSALLERLAGMNRGLNAEERDRQAILVAAAALEAYNPTPRPTETPQKLDGNWRLLYTTSEELLNLGRVPALKLGQIYQCIRASSGRVYNVAEITGLPLLEGLVSVGARFEVVSERRVNVQFERFVLGLQRLINYTDVNNFLERFEAGEKFRAVDFEIKNREQRGWLEVTYLDDDLRISRGNEGSLFVLSKY
ncbi:PAP/fibrillin family protein [Leptolyngbya sp. FACHB-261]|uniref:PAP/fibrillin family protein n=1 Tax=Leptolyngbya sp. FACHB-261 TaxID=2692806 RepID=UPI001683C999|nr:PAP/fibrillin family protein [Leptolyngbya sp. FACHB-261]MBD2104790.1 PAP/fibrillin family protein [Leptolyngbya sp. FACHB-261]